MARFDVYRMQGSDSFLIELQSDYLDWITTRVVAPLVPREHAPKQIKHLNPIFRIHGHDYVMITQSMAAVPTNALVEVATNLSTRQDEITHAVDMVFQRY